MNDLLINDVNNEIPVKSHNRTLWRNRFVVCSQRRDNNELIFRFLLPNDFILNLLGFCVHLLLVHHKTEKLHGEIIIFWSRHLFFCTPLVSNEPMANGLMGWPFMLHYLFHFSIFCPLGLAFRLAFVLSFCGFLSSIRRSGIGRNRKNFTRKSRKGGREYYIVHGGNIRFRYYSLFIRWTWAWWRQRRSREVRQCVFVVVALVLYFICSLLFPNLHFAIAQLLITLYENWANQSQSEWNFFFKFYSILFYWRTLSTNLVKVHPFLTEKKITFYHTNK